ncbi:MAG: hypothetical protein ACXVPN_12110 [Bacteroidia bacterium]
MKKIILFITSFSLLSILFTGCKSNMFVKRHYNDGYYIAKSERPHTPRTNSAIHASSGKPQRSAYPAKQQLSRPENTAQAGALPAPYSVSADVKPALGKPVSLTKETTSALKKIKAYTLKMPEIKKTVLKPAKPSGDAARDGLSLFWIVILAILILWAIAFIAGGFGLGDLIHVLLIIALVLLILWLLRIL